MRFEIGPGDADTVLKTFAEQSGRQVIYPTALVQGQRLPGIKGTMPPREALVRILSSTALTTWEDEQTGAFAIGRDLSLAPEAALRARPAIRLPPFIVEEQTEIKWRYATAPGIEVLSQCSDYETVALMEQHYLLHSLLGVLVPPSLRFSTDVPTTYIFFKETKQSTVTKDLLRSLKKHEAETAAARGKRPEEIESRVLPNYRFWDPDALAVFFIWDEVERTAMMPSDDYVRYLIEHRSPALPRWYCDGMLELYSRSVMNTTPVGNPVVRRFNDGLLPFGKPEPNSISLKRPVWIDEHITEVLLQSLAGGRSDFEARLIQLDAEPLSLEELIADRVPAHHDERYDRRRRSTAALFIRLMLAEWKRGTSEVAASRAGGERNAGLVKVTTGTAAKSLASFVELASTKPVRPPDFQAAFGRDYADMDATLRDAMRGLLSQQYDLRPPELAALGPVEVRDATKAEVSRLKGGFNRLEIGYVRELYPTLTSEYVTQARRTLHRSFDAGDRDPRLLAELGLCEVDAGNDSGAVAFLEPAVEANIVRPRAYYELARIRFASLRSQHPGAKLDAAQLKAVLAPLYAMRSQTPPLVEAYELMTEAWLRSDQAPLLEHFAVLDEAVAKFPTRSRFVLSVALLNATYGRTERARALIASGIAMARDPADRDRFWKLAAVISGNDAAGAKQRANAPSK